MTDTELIARQAKQIAELRTSAKTITWPVVHHDVLSALLDAAEENVRLREQVELLKIHGRVGVEALAERDALRAENRRLNAIILAGGETLERQRVELAQNHEDWTALRAENAKLRTVRACAWRWLTYETSAERASLEVALAATEKEPK